MNDHDETSGDVADHGSPTIRLSAPLTLTEKAASDARLLRMATTGPRIVAPAYPTATTTRDDAAFDQALADLAYVLGLDATHADALRARALSIAAANARTTPTTTQEP